MRLSAATLLLLVILVSPATPLFAQEHAYAPSEAQLTHATEKWLVWLPDDEGESLDAPTKEQDEEEEKKEKDEGTEIPGLEKFKEPPKLEVPDPRILRRVFVVQESADKSALRRIVVDWEPEGLGQSPNTPFAVTVLDDGTLVTTDFHSNLFALQRHGPDGKSHRDACFAKGKAGALVEAYPDGIVMQVPGPDPVQPRDLVRERGFKEFHLYWVPFGDHGIDDRKAARMTFSEISAQFGLRVARFGNSVAIPGYIYDLKRKKRKKFDYQSSQSIDAFDGTTAISGRFSYAVREKDHNLSPGDQEFFVARNGIGYWFDPGNRGVWRIFAVRFKDREGKKLEFGRFPFEGDKWNLNVRLRAANTIVALRAKRVARMTIYWTARGLTWADWDGDRWVTRAWLTDKDFE